jgi:hypothetical protein
MSEHYTINSKNAEDNKVTAHLSVADKLHIIPLTAAKRYETKRNQEDGHLYGSVRFFYTVLK